MDELHDETVSAMKLDSSGVLQRVNIEWGFFGIQKLSLWSCGGTDSCFVMAVAVEAKMLISLCYLKSMHAPS